MLRYMRHNSLEKYIFTPDLQKQQFHRSNIVENLPCILYYNHSNTLRLAIHVQSFFN